MRECAGPLVRQDERVYGNEAQNLLGKLPAQQFVLSKILLGAHMKSPEVREPDSVKALRHCLPPCGSSGPCVHCARVSRLA